MVICLERGADLHMAQLMPLPLTVSCFTKIQIGFTFLVPAHLGSPGQTAVRRARVCVCVCVRNDHSNLPLTAANLLLLTRRCADAAAVTVTLVTRASKQTCVASNLFSPAPFPPLLASQSSPFSFSTSFETCPVRPFFLQFIFLSVYTFHIISFPVPIGFLYPAASPSVFTLSCPFL